MSDSNANPSQVEHQKPKSRGLLKSSAIVSSMTMLSRVLGLVRDMIIARLFGADAQLDAFWVAFKIPNFFRRLFAEGAFAQAFVPVLSEYRANGSVAAVRHFIDRVAGCLGITLLLMTVFAVVASPIVTAIFSPGFFLNSPEKYSLTSDLLRITFPYLMLISMTGLAGAILNSYDRFAVPAITPVFLNISLITAALVFSPLFDIPVFALAWGVAIAGCIQFLFQLPFLMKLGLMPHPKVDWSDDSVRKVLRLMAPAMFGVSVSQINLLLDTVLVTFLPVSGSVSWLYFSDRLVELPLGVFGVGIATVVLPNLSRQFAQGAEHFSVTVDWAIRMILLIALPSACALLILAEPILFTLFQYGKFDAFDIRMASYSLQAYTLGLTAFMLIKVLASAFFSRQDMKTPVKIGIIAMVSNMVFNVLFVAPLYFIWNIGHVGLALATAASACLNAGLLLRTLVKEGIYHRSAGWQRFGFQLLFANGVMVSVLLVLAQWIPRFDELDWQFRVIFMAIYVISGIISYAFTLFLAGIRVKHLKLDV